MGWVHNLAHPDAHSHVARVIAICLTFSISAVIALLLRFYIRLHSKRALWLDDYSAACSAVLGLAYAGIAVAQTRYGLGLDAASFPDANVVMFSKIQYAGGPTYILAILCFKVSLLTSYLRIGGFVATYRWSIIGVVIAVVAKQWDASLPGTCIDTVASYYGFFITIIQIIRIFTIKHLKTYTDSQPIVLWSQVEISLGVIIACVPTYGPYFHAFASTLTSSYNTRRQRRQHASQSQTMDAGRSYALSGVRR
ncbi:integral membrane protein [Aspergillus luchuensis IFO 4308]|nr:integral membrane protein [Aspergillus luchuensis IFO 4308]